MRIVRMVYTVAHICCQNMQLRSIHYQLEHF
ncbi:hypothetical protein CDL12_08354 [Handroanthus impetiginosus]|uniref:Uncharacterized protein n=1 Tax=Handroanthus impetiginosus TaxID=429701 RepID=A0A2G9HN59_9LAMI|nr:hypothetical protein CDL12_08354 [Handroanthus impetiginosus]